MTEQRSLWGPETEKAIASFPISGEPIPIRVVHWLGQIKSAAATAHLERSMTLHAAERRRRQVARDGRTGMAHLAPLVRGIG